MHESPRAGVTLGVEGPTIFRIIVLVESGRNTGRLSNVDLTRRIQQGINGELRSGLLHLTSTMSSNLESVSRRINSRMLYH